MSPVDRPEPEFPVKVVAVAWHCNRCGLIGAPNSCAYGVLLDSLDVLVERLSTAEALNELCACIIWPMAPSTCNGVGQLFCGCLVAQSEKATGTRLLSPLLVYWHLIVRPLFDSFFEKYLAIF